jgi:translation initiation factor IF-2
MQQRRVRLGDILDDYCPRERRITNHAVVAMIEDEVKQTRCTTCDADHEYKQAKLPPPRRGKKPEASLVASAQGAAFARPPVADPEPPVIDESLSDAPADLLEPPSGEETADVEMQDAEPVSGDLGEPESGEPESSEPEPVDDSDEWPVHRPLIRATLPRPEGQVPERKAPEFTIRQNNGRFDGQRNGNNRHRGQRQAQGGQSRFGNPRSGSGQGQSGHGSGHGQRHGNRPGPPGGGGGQRGGGRPAGHGGRGQGRGPKRGGR